jgi:hypothetical protein
MLRPFSAFLVLFVVLLTSCKQQHRIVGDYRLEQLEDGQTYYLHKAGQEDSAQGGSIIGGTVLRMGWTTHYIVAERYSINRGDPDGWMITDVRTGTMTGPFTKADFQARPESKGIQIYEVSETWKNL